MAVLLVEHDIDRVFAIADKITVMNEGKVLVEGDAETVRGNAEVQRVYIGGGHAARAARAADRSRGRQAAAGAVRHQHLLRQEPYPARRELRGARERSRGAARAQRRREILDLQEHHGHRARRAPAQSTFDGQSDQRADARADRAAGRGAGAAGTAAVRRPHAWRRICGWAACRAAAERGRALGSRAHLQLLPAHPRQTATRGPTSSPAASSRW